MRAIIITVVGVVMLGGACAGNDAEQAGDSDASPALCSEVYVDGGPVTPAVTEGVCELDDGTLSAFGAMIEDCADGTQIGWNDLAWWADGVVTLHEDGAERVAPASVRDACAG